MKNSYALLFFLGAALAASAADATLAEFQRQVALAKARLELAEAQVALAAKQAEQAKEQSNQAEAPAEPPKDTWPRGAQNERNVFFHTGLRVLTPYTLDYATKKISSNDTRTGGFLEVVATNIWAWQPEYIFQSREAAKARRADRANGDATKAQFNNYDWQALVRPDLLDEGWDYTSRLSFEFGADQEASAATITGSGDVAAELGIAKHIVRGWTPKGAWSVGLVGAVGMTTDRQARRVHPSYLVGINATSSFQVENSRLALLRLNVGWAKVDGILYDKPEEDTIVFEGNVPKFDAQWRPSVEAELWWPIDEAMHVTAGAKLYGHPRNRAGRLDQWTLYLGATLAIPDALGALKPKKAKD